MARYIWYGLFWAVVVGSAIVAVFLLTLWPSMAQVIQAVLLVATFWAVAFYTFETRQLRLQQQTDQEIHQHPWLSISEYSLRASPDERATSDDLVVSAEISNLGLTPALQIDVDATFVWRSERDQRTCQRTQVGTLVPQGKVIWRLPVKAIGVGTAELHLALTYRTLTGGTAVAIAETEITDPAAFRYLSSQYSVTLSGGHTLPDGFIPLMAIDTKE